jgi:outer membrane protein assembly factor BamB
MKNMKMLKLALNLIMFSLLLPGTASFAANWQVPIGTIQTLYYAWVAASPVLGSDGTIYITSAASSGGNLYSVNPSGTINWTYGISANSSGEGFPSVAVDGAGYVYVDSDLSLISVNSSDSTENWSYTVDGEADTSPVVGNDGTVYFVSDDPGVLFAITNGQPKWIHDFSSGEFESSPFVGSDGIVYVKTEGGLFANSPTDGHQIWYCPVPTTHELDLPPIMDNYNLYVGSSDDNLYAINPADGSVLWKYDSGSPINSRPSLDANGNIIFGNDEGQLYSVNSQGSGQLIFTAPDSQPQPIRTQTTFGADGTIYVTSWDGNLYALQRQPDGTAAIEWQFATGGPIRSNPVLGTDGTIYFCSTDGNLYAVDPHSLFPVSPTPIEPPTGPSGPPPTLPIGRGLTAASCSRQVFLTWNAYDGATGYKVYRSTASGGTYIPITSTTTATTYTDTSVANGTPYYYVVLAVNGGNEIATSGYICITPLTAPAAPTSLVVAAGNEAAYLLSWTPVAGAVSYNIKRSFVSGSETFLASTTVTHYTDNGLDNGTTYYYVVSAVDSCGDESANSAEANVTPEYASAPVFTSGALNGNLYANCSAGVGGSGTYFTFTVTGPPNSTWTVWSLPEGEYYNDPQIIGTITLDSSGNGSFEDDGAGTFDWSSQFYQLVSGDVHSTIFGYALEDIIDTPSSYAAIQNPLVSPDPTLGAVLTPLNSFWNSSDGSHYIITESSPGFFDDSIALTSNWDDEWVDGIGWAYPLWRDGIYGEFIGWNSINSLPYGCNSDTYYFYGFPCDFDYYGNPENYIIITFIGSIPQ